MLYYGMSIQYTKHTLTDIETKIHDARRKLESMLRYTKMGVIPGDKEVTDLHTDLVEALTLLSDYYIRHLNNFEDVEEIELKTEEPPSNIVPLFPNKEDK